MHSTSTMAPRQPGITSTSHTLSHSLNHSLSHSHSLSNPHAVHFFQDVPKPTTAPTPLGRALTSSERGLRYRAKRKAHQATLESEVQQLREHIAALEARRCLLAPRGLDPFGSLVRLVCRYYTQMEASMAQIPVLGGGGALSPAQRAQRRNEQVTFQERFLRQIMHPQVRHGTGVGIGAVLAQWHRVSGSHGSCQNRIARVTTGGSTECPLVVMDLQVSAVALPTTFRQLFPRPSEAQDRLTRRLQHRRLQYKLRLTFQFTEDGRILSELADMGYVDAWLQAGASLLDVGAVVQDEMGANDHYRQKMPPHVQGEERQRQVGRDADVKASAKATSAEVDTPQANATGTTVKSDKMCLGFLLSTSTDTGV